MPFDDPAGVSLAAITGFRLVTADLARLRRFYAETLGFALDGPEQAMTAQELAALGLNGAGRRQAMRLGSQQVTLEQFDPIGRPYPDRGDAASLWFQHLALVVDDMGTAYRRVAAAPAISEGGPQHLPESSGGVDAFKFRDPDGHPLELLHFPAATRPAAWQGRPGLAGQIGLGIDHSAISVADADASTSFYRALGLKPGARTVNHGPEQQGLDGLGGVEVVVAPLRPASGGPHLELLDYRTPRGAGGPPARTNDVAATRIVWQGSQAALLRDPDGHIVQVALASGAGR